MKNVIRFYVLNNYNYYNKNFKIFVTKNIFVFYGSQIFLTRIKRQTILLTNNL